MGREHGSRVGDFKGANKLEDFKRDFVEQETQEVNTTWYVNDKPTEFDQLSKEHLVSIFFVCEKDVKELTFERDHLNSRIKEAEAKQRGAKKVLEEKYGVTDIEALRVKKGRRLRRTNGG